METCINYSAIGTKKKSGMREEVEEGSGEGRRKKGWSGGRREGED